MIRGSLATRNSDFNGHFDEYLSPYLFDKHMQRGKIVFEQFSLVQANKTDAPLDGQDYAVDGRKSNTIRAAKAGYMDKS